MLIYHVYLWQRLTNEWNKTVGMKKSLLGRSVMPMTYWPETGNRKLVPESGTSFWYQLQDFWYVNVNVNVNRGFI